MCTVKSATVDGGAAESSKVAERCGATVWALERHIQVAIFR